jgi:hypothetical protein
MSGASKFEGTTLINIKKNAERKNNVHYLFFVKPILRHVTGEH